MTRRRFYAPPESFSPDGLNVTLSAEESRHLRSVLRLQAGDDAFVFDGAGQEFHGHVQKVSRDSASIEIINQVEAARPESTLDLTLGVAVIKGEKFDLVIQKATELGVMRIVPLLTSRGDVKIKSNDDADRKKTRWQRIALEATKQCGRARHCTLRPYAILPRDFPAQRFPAARTARLQRQGNLHVGAGEELPVAVRQVVRQGWLPVLPHHQRQPAAGANHRAFAALAGRCRQRTTLHKNHSTRGLPLDAGYGSRSPGFRGNVGRAGANARLGVSRSA